MLTDIWSAMWAFATEQHILSVNQNVSFLSSLALSLSRTAIQIKGNTQNFHKCDDFSIFSQTKESLYI